MWVAVPVTRVIVGIKVAVTGVTPGGLVAEAVTVTISGGRVGTVSGARA